MRVDKGVWEGMAVCFSALTAISLLPALLIEFGFGNPVVAAVMSRYRLEYMGAHAGLITFSCFCWWMYFREG